MNNKKIFILLIFGIFCYFNVFGITPPDTIITSNNNNYNYCEILHDNSLLLMDSNNNYVILHPEYSFWSNWEIGMRIGLIRNIPFNPYAEVKGVNTCYGINLYKQLTKKFNLNINFNHFNLINTDDNYYNISTAMLYRLINLSNDLNKNTECNVYITLGAGIGKSKQNYYTNNNNSELNYDIFTGLAVSCRFKKIKLRIEDNIYMPGTLSIDGFNVDMLSHNYFHCWTIGFSFNIGLTNKDKLLLQSLIY